MDLFSASVPYQMHVSISQQLDVDSAYTGMLCAHLWQMHSPDNVEMQEKTPTKVKPGLTLETCLILNALFWFMVWRQRYDLQRR